MALAKTQPQLGKDLMISETITFEHRQQQPKGK